MAEQLDADARETILASLLRLNPEAPVVAIREDGIFTELPEAPDLDGRSTLPGRSALDLVPPACRVAIIDAWEEAKAGGAAHAVVRLVGDGQEHAELHFVNLVHRLGIFLGVLVATEDGGTTADRLHEAVAVAPRVCRVEKSTLAVVTAVDEATTQIL